MGRRSNFPRRPRDTYDTPASAVSPLIPHLPPGVPYWEPCGGAGKLVEAIAPFCQCVMATDIEPRSPVVKPLPVGLIKASDADVFGAGMFITNPPWPARGRKGEPVISIIRHLSAIRPTWLLLPFTFAANGYFAKVSGSCAKIVMIGRVSWMENDIPGKDDAAWFLFDAAHIGPTRFFGQSAVKGD